LKNAKLVPDAGKKFLLLSRHSIVFRAA